MESTRGNPHSQTLGVVQLVLPLFSVKGITQSEYDEKLKVLARNNNKMHNQVSCPIEFCLDDKEFLPGVAVGGSTAASMGDSPREYGRGFRSGNFPPAAQEITDPLSGIRCQSGAYLEDFTYQAPPLPSDTYGSRSANRGSARRPHGDEIDSPIRLGLEASECELEPLQEVRDVAQGYMQQRTPETHAMSRAESSTQLYVEVFLEKEVIGGIDIRTDSPLSVVRQELQRHDIGSGHFDHLESRTATSPSYLFLAHGRSPISPAREATSTIEDILVKDDHFPFIVLRLTPIEDETSGGSGDAELHFQKGLAFMSLKSQWTKAQSDRQVQQLEQEARQKVQSQREDIENLKKVSRDQAQQLREQTYLEQKKLEQKHETKLQQLADHLKHEKDRMKTELVNKAREAESRVVASQLLALQQEQETSKALRGTMQHQMIRVVGRYFMKSFTGAYVDQWRRNTLHDLMATGLNISLPELSPEQYSHYEPEPDRELQARQQKARAIEVQLLREVDCILALEDPMKLASVKSLLQSHLSGSQLQSHLSGSQLQSHLSGAQLHQQPASVALDQTMHARQQRHTPALVRAPHGRKRAPARSPAPLGW